MPLNFCLSTVPESVGKGLMTHVWANGSQWSYLLIQPHYFTSIKYICSDRSLLPPSPNASQQHANQKGGMRVSDSLCFSSPSSWTVLTHLQQAFRKKLVTATCVNGSNRLCDPLTNLYLMQLQPYLALLYRAHNAHTFFINICI